jgi:hypothetical protein
VFEALSENVKDGTWQLFLEGIQLSSFGYSLTLGNTYNIGTKNAAALMHVRTVIKEPLSAVENLATFLFPFTLRTYELVSNNGNSCLIVILICQLKYHSLQFFLSRFEKVSVSSSMMLSTLTKYTN